MNQPIMSATATQPVPVNIRRVIIGAPFGNYIQPPNCTHTLGTFTVTKRGGKLYRLWRCMRTLRPLWPVKGWVNKLGLPNPGLPDLIRRVGAGTWDNFTSVHNSIISIKGFCEDDWKWLLQRAHRLWPPGIELNVSCPNVGHSVAECVDELSFLKKWLEAGRADENNQAIIAKLPPIGWREYSDRFYDLGIRWFHCCNTLPVPGGGVSGHVLKPYSLEAVAGIKSKYPDAIVIGGGGIYSVSDAKEYWAAGADHVAIASALLNPLRRNLPTKVLMGAPQDNL